MTADEFKTATRGITNARIAELIGRGVSAVYEYRTGRTAIPIDVAKKIIELEKAMDRIETPPPPRPRYHSIVDGKLYDTRSAEWIFGPLYRTKNGVFFWADESEVSPLPLDEAKRMIEKRGADLYCAIFGKPE